MCHLCLFVASRLDLNQHTFDYLSETFYFSRFQGPKKRSQGKREGNACQTSPKKTVVCLNFGNITAHDMRL